jgi:RND family efflux transporter MFP subunit
MRARIPWAVLMASTLAFSQAACGKAAREEEIASADEPTITATVGTVARRDLVDALVVRGAVAALPNQDVKIAALVGGRVDRVAVAEGDAVAAGQVVAEIDPQPLTDQRRQATAAVAQATAAVENARLNLERTERLFQRGIAAGKEVEDARAQRAAADGALEQANATLETVTRQLGRARVTSPIAGIVVKRLVAAGEQVDGTAAQPLVEVANLDRVEIAAAVPAEYLGRIRTGQHASVSTDAYPDQRFDGELLAIAPAIDPATNTALTRIRLANPGHLLKVGMFVEARIAIGERKAVLTVPPTAVAKDGDAAAVYVVSGAVATRTPVTLGLQTSDAVEILSGVKEGDRVLTDSIHGLGARARLGQAQ